MRIDKIDLGRQSSGDRVGILYTWPLGTLFLTTREILTTHLPKNRRQLLPSVQLSPQKRGRGRRGCHGAIVPAGNALLDGLRPPQMPCTQHSQAWGILETIWSRHTRPLHTEGNLEQPGADSGR